MGRPAGGSTSCGVSVRWRPDRASPTRRLKSRSWITAGAWCLPGRRRGPPSCCRRRRSRPSRIGPLAGVSTLRSNSKLSKKPCSVFCLFSQF
ncbi:unnamed protein product [Linum tenue]|uniref:Uncharacterized protein n=1 Tax=Linum tenue TaxID=586396 RepID=A0AAV0S7B0_9ROSI|nr:unnamed protein product [Linum tenue]